MAVTALVVVDSLTPAGSDPGLPAGGAHQRARIAVRVVSSAIAKGALKARYAGLERD